MSSTGGSCCFTVVKVSLTFCGVGAHAGDLGHRRVDLVEGLHTRCVGRTRTARAVPESSGAGSVLTLVLVPITSKLRKKRSSTGSLLERHYGADARERLTGRGRVQRVADCGVERPIGLAHGQLDAVLADAHGPGLEWCRPAVAAGSRLMKVGLLKR